MCPLGAPGRRRSRSATGEPSGLAAAGSPAAGVSVTAPPFFPPPPRSRPPPPPPPLPLHTRRCRCRRLGRKARASPRSADPVERRAARTRPGLAAPRHLPWASAAPRALPGDLPPLRARLGRGACSSCLQALRPPPAVNVFSSSLWLEKINLAIPAVPCLGLRKKKNL